MKTLLFLITICLSLVANCKNEEQPIQDPFEPTVEAPVVQPEDFDNQASAKETSLAKKVIIGIGSVLSLCCGGYLLNEWLKHSKEELFKEKYLNKMKDEFYESYNNFAPEESQNNKYKVYEYLNSNFDKEALKSISVSGIGISPTSGHLTQCQFKALAALFKKYYDFLDNPFSLEQILLLYRSEEVCIKNNDSVLVSFNFNQEINGFEFSANLSFDNRCKIIKLSDYAVKSVDDLIKINNNKKAMEAISQESLKLISLSVVTDFKNLFNA